LPILALSWLGCDFCNTIGHQQTHALQHGGQMLSLNKRKTASRRPCENSNARHARRNIFGKLRIMKQIMLQIYGSMPR
jgi:hypothetical protein